MIKPEILLEEFRNMMENMERRGYIFEKDFQTLFQSFLVAMKISNKVIIEMLEREVTKYGTGAHIVVPQKHLGKKAIIIISNNNKK